MIVRHCLSPLTTTLLIITGHTGATSLPTSAACRRLSIFFAKLNSPELSFALFLLSSTAHLWDFYIPTGLHVKQKHLNFSPYNFPPVLNIQPEK